MLIARSHLGSRTVAAAAVVGVAIAISSFTIVRAEHASPAGSVTYKCSSGAACVTGSSSGSKTYGVLGFSAGADGVHGLTHATNGGSAVAGIADATSGHAQGVFGRSSNGAGVYGSTSGPLTNGVEGHVLNYGRGDGVAGYGTANGIGVYGIGSTGVEGESSTGSAIFAKSDNAYTDIFYGEGPVSSAYCVMDYAGNLTCTGSITGGSPALTRHRTGGGRRVLAYASESPEATIEDSGTARMDGGIARVDIDPAFASVANGRWYYVFLTPLGDTRGLYVSMKTPTAFVVREVERGRSSLQFDYRIVARPFDGGGAGPTSERAAQQDRAPDARVKSTRVAVGAGASPAGSVTYKCTSGAACVEGSSSGSKTYGVLGFSAGSDGVHGLTHSTNGYSAVGGVADATNGAAQGVFGRSSTGAGVYGATSGYNDNAVEGHVLNNGTGYGVAGYGGSFGVYGLGASGVFGEGSSSTGGGSAVVAKSDNINTDIFNGNGPVSTQYCYIDPGADLHCTGSITGGSPAGTRHRTRSGQRVLAYSSESATATVEDVGTARLSDGVANVQIDRAFASVTDHRWYYVFLTPLGDTRGLYVSMKTPTAFQVREVEHGRSGVEFDYRIVAHPLDAGNDRLPPEPPVRRPLIRAQPAGSEKEDE